MALTGATTNNQSLRSLVGHQQCTEYRRSIDYLAFVAFHGRRAVAKHKCLLLNLTAVDASKHTLEKESSHAHGFE